MNALVIGTAVYFAAVVALVVGYWVYDLGVDVIRARLKRAKLSLKGERQWSPPMDMMNPVTVPIDDPLESWLLQASDAERRYYALYMLLEDIEENRMLPHAEKRDLHDYVRREMYEARSEAEKNIESRLEWKTVQQELNEWWIIEDPVLHYRRRVEIPIEQSVRGDTEHMLEQQIKRTAQNVLNEVTHEV